MNIKHTVKPICFAVAALFGTSAGVAFADEKQYEPDSQGIIGMKTEDDVKNLSGNKAARFNNTTGSDTESDMRDTSELGDNDEQVTSNMDDKMKTEATDYTQDESTSELSADKVVYFDFDSAELDEEAKSELSDMVEEAELAGETLEIHGFTDSVGEQAYNKDLSQRRANAVKEFLQGEVESQDSLVFSTQGMGEAKPIASNNDATGRQKNRRVEIIMKNRDEVAGL